MPPLLSWSSTLIPAHLAGCYTARITGWKGTPLDTFLGLPQPRNGEDRYTAEIWELGSWIKSITLLQRNSSFLDKIKQLLGMNYCSPASAQWAVLRTDNPLRARQQPGAAVPLAPRGDCNSRNYSSLRRSPTAARKEASAASAPASSRSASAPELGYAPPSFRSQER